MAWQTAQLRSDYDALAPDRSEIRLLVQSERGSLVHCTLRPAQVTQAVRHRTVEEVWFCTSGSGQVWRSTSGGEEVTEIRPGTALTIPVGTEFQFRTTGAQALEILITTMPPWPGADEAVPVENHWAPSV
jgi:mannose-6-phosphate isomerase-like protein (cupin superfamily)